MSGRKFRPLLWFVSLVTVLLFATGRLNLCLLRAGIILTIWPWYRARCFLRGDLRGDLPRGWYWAQIRERLSLPACQQGSWRL